MTDPNVFLGLPLEFGNICKVYPPKVKEIVANAKILQLYKLLTYSQEDIEDLLSLAKTSKLLISVHTYTITISYMS